MKYCTLGIQHLIRDSTLEVDDLVQVSRITPKRAQIFLSTQYFHSPQNTNNISLDYFDCELHI